MAAQIRAEAPPAIDAENSIRAYRSGDKQRGEDLVASIRHIVKRRLKRLSATEQECEELVQECTITVLQRVDEYRPDLGSFDGWVSGFAHNSWRSYLRTVSRQRRTTVAIDDVATATYEIAADINQRNNLASAIESLELLDRELLHMRFSMGMSSDEIAAASDMNAPQVRKRISRAVERLRRHPATQALLLSIAFV